MEKTPMSAQETTARSQLEVLKRIAVFSAALRGHQLAGWLQTPESATAACAVCGLRVAVRLWPWQPRIDGEALETMCTAASHHKVAWTFQYPPGPMRATVRFEPVNLQCMRDAVILTITASIFAGRKC